MEPQEVAELMIKLKAWVKRVKSDNTESSRKVLSTITSLKSSAVNVFASIHISSKSGLRLIPINYITEAKMINITNEFQMTIHFNKIGLPETFASVSNKMVSSINYNGLIYLSRYHPKINDLIDAYFKFLEFL